MIVKRYVVKDMPEALGRIRQDLGNDAVILSSKKVKQRGFLGIFYVTQLEVVAAVNDGGYEPSKKKTANSTQSVKAKEQPAKPTAEAPVLHSSQEDTDVQIASARVPVQAAEAALAAVQSTEVKRMPVQATAAEDGLAKEVQEMRSVLAKFLNQNEEMMPDSVKQIRSELISNDLDPDHVERLILKALQENNEINLINEQEFRQILTNLIMKEINDSFLSSTLFPESRVVAFVGPTGVGKTTTIAKIAAEAMLKNKRKVGLITTDTYRIAAVEQLKIYANILQLPVEVVFSTDEIAQAIDNMQDRDLILIDTAGRNYQSSELVDELNGQLRASQPDETCLVLSLTTKSSDLENIVANFEDVSIDKFIFTKLDETSSYGAIYNLIHRFGKPLAYLTYGQNVPDDIETAEPERVARLVVGEKLYV